VRKSALAFFGSDITELARRGKLEPVIGRKDEILRVARILSQKRKANPVLVGEPGVGKTGIVEGLAQRIASSECPEFLRDARIVEISMSALRTGANSYLQENACLTCVEDAPVAVSSAPHRPGSI
jgi:ATP-dependent Clp protease ATP-binding subunit ClpB